MTDEVNKCCSVYATVTPDQTKATLQEHINNLKHDTTCITGSALIKLILDLGPEKPVKLKQCEGMLIELQPRDISADDKCIRINV